MSRRHTGTYSAEEIEELRTRYSNERVDAMVAEAKAIAAEEADDVLGEGGDGSESSSEPDPYADLKVEELQELLKQRKLSTDGRKAELQDRLREDDAKQ